MSYISSGSLQQILDRVCGEYLEMPGLQLTSRQAQRLWGLDEQTCGQILGVLLQKGFLRETRDGHFARLMDGPITRGQLKMTIPIDTSLVRRGA